MWAHNASALITIECAIELAGFGVALTIKVKANLEQKQLRLNDFTELS